MLRSSPSLSPPRPSRSPWWPAPVRSTRARRSSRLGATPEAKATFAALEGDSRGWNDARRAEYALYRGLTLGALGDRPQAVVWLRDARAIDEAHPGSLTPDAQRRLKIGLASAEGE